ncbi:MAG: VCBS repeat-containing protein [Rhodothermia bacterium]|nr:VCBS repeat-containing protein [Rhodothermia bacterium]
MRLLDATPVVVLALLTATACAQEALLKNAPGSPLRVEGGPSIVRLADFNDDGILDLVVALSSDLAVSVYAGDGKGAFEVNPTARVPVSLEPTELAVDDLNGDGWADVAVGSHDSYEVWLYFGDGRGGISPATKPLRMREGNRPHTHGLVLADVNEDDLVDIVTVNNEDNDVAVMLSGGQGRFEPAPGSPFPVGASPYPPGVGDANGDGFIDIAVPSTVRSGKGSIDLLIGDGGGGFARETVPIETPRPWQAAIGNGSVKAADRSGNVVVSHWERPRISLLSFDPASGGWSETVNSPLTADIAAFEISIADMNGDGLYDIVGVAGDEVGVLLGREDGGLQSAPGSPYEIGGGAWQLDVGDLNGDGQLDVVAGCADENVVSVLIGR